MSPGGGGGGGGGGRGGRGGRGRERQCSTTQRAAISTLLISVFTKTVVVVIILQGTDNCWFLPTNIVNEYIYIKKIYNFLIWIQIAARVISLPPSEQVRKQVVCVELPFCRPAPRRLLKSPEALQYYRQPGNNRRQESQRITAWEHRAGDSLSLSLPPIKS